MSFAQRSNGETHLESRQALEEAVTPIVTAMGEQHYGFSCIRATPLMQENPPQRPQVLSSRISWIMVMHHDPGDSLVVKQHGKRVSGGLETPPGQPRLVLSLWGGGATAPRKSPTQTHSRKENGARLRRPKTHHGRMPRTRRQASRAVGGVLLTFDRGTLCAAGCRGDTANGEGHGSDGTDHAPHGNGPGPGVRA